MVAKRRILSFCVLAMSLSVAGCGGGSTMNVQNPPAQVLPAASIAFQPKPLGAIFVNQTATFTAVVSNDSTNAGVDWSLPCPSGANCGTLSPLHTPSGKASTYTPPSSVAGNSQTFTILAFAAADHTRNLTTQMTVSGFAGTLKGTYVIQTSGSDPGGPYQLAGTVVLDGKAGITAGEQTINAFNANSGSSVSVADAITGGSYFIGSDGRGTITINTNDQNIGQQGIETFTLVVLSSSKALLTKIDDPTIPGTSSETAAGTLDLQTSKAAPSGGYAFVANGTDINGSPMAVGGVMNIDSPKTISGTGSVTDQDLAGTLTPKASLSGTVSDPDPFGAVKFDLTTGFAAGLEFTGYIVDTTHIKLIESDNTVAGAGVGRTVGVAVGQGAATGTFIGKTAFSGNYVFGISGFDLGSFLPASLASAGVFTADGNGLLTSGFIDEFLAAFGDISVTFKGHYFVDAAGTGRVGSSTSFHGLGPGPEFIFYLTGNGTPPLILDADVNMGAVGTGGAYVAAPQVSFNGKYGVTFTQNLGFEIDSSGPMAADGTAGTLAGTIDTNFGLSPFIDTPLTGTFQTTTLADRFTGTLSNEALPGGGPVAAAFYLIDSTQGFFVETDSANTGNQMFGYFTSRTPICQTCP